MDPLLIYIREDYLELLSMDSNGRVLPVNYQASNKVPMYFLLNGDQIQMDQYAKKQFSESTSNSFGNFWKNTGNQSLLYSRFHKNHAFDTLLPYALKENILPEVIKSHFHSSNYSDFIKQKRTFLLFDSFIGEEQKEIITKGFLEIIEFAPDNLTILDFWELFRSFEHPDEDAILFVNAALGNIYIHLVGAKYPFHISKNVIEGKGRDPRIDTILDFVAEKAIARGSSMSVSELKNMLLGEANLILEKLPNGFVQHTIRDNNIDVNPLRLDFNSIELEGRLNNKQSINYIQNEFENFRRNNNALQLGIYLSGKIITQPVFSEFFKSTYNKVKEDSVNSYNQFLEFVLRKCRSEFDLQDPTKIDNQVCLKISSEAQSKPLKGQEKSGLIVNTPPVVATTPEVTTPPGVKAPPVFHTPPRVTTPPVVKAPPVVATPPKVTILPVVKAPAILKPEVKMPPINKDVKQGVVPLPPIHKIKMPPPPPPPPPVKKK